MLDNVNKRILFELERNARISDSALARIVGKSKDSIRYRIKKLEDEKIILGYRTWIDYSKLGYRTSTIYLNLINLPEKRKKLIEELKKDKRVYWLGVAEGVWNIGVTYFIKSNEDLFKIKGEILTKYKELIIDSRLTSLASVSVHEKNFLVNEKSSFITFTEGIENYELDEIEKKILKELYNNSKINLSDLEFKTKSTLDIVRSRMKKLEKLGIIIRYTIYINYKKIGYELYKTFIYLSSYSKEEIENILKYSEKSEKIINVVKQIAPWDFEFIIFAENFEDYLNTINNLTAINPKAFKKFETAIMSEDIIFPCNEAYI
ncbi:MAG: AsnC family transcriptional regulator [Nanoarchaeota archaeon]|nr:AsnC family transcriptional regulator [Nanoarchaeota archaeon]